MVVSARVGELDAALVRQAAEVEELSVSQFLGNLIRQQRPSLAEIAYGAKAVRQRERIAS
jgi:uncharacterized protein (DUF1778 family)